MLARLPVLGYRSCRPEWSWSWFTTPRIRGIAAEVMPAGFFEDFAGQSRLEINEGNTTLIAFGLAVIITYLVLAAQFESFRDPLVMMLSVPLSIFGALVPLNLGRMSIGTLFTLFVLPTFYSLIARPCVPEARRGPEMALATAE